MSDLKEFYSLKEVAEMLGVSKKTVESWVYKKTINTVKIGRLRKVRKSEFERLKRGE